MIYILIFTLHSRKLRGSGRQSLFSIYFDIIVTGQTSKKKERHDLLLILFVSKCNNYLRKTFLK